MGRLTDNQIVLVTRPTKAVTMAKATLNTGETRYAVNDIIIGTRTHISARYTISVGGHTENHSCADRCPTPSPHRRGATGPKLRCDS